MVQLEVTVLMVMVALWSSSYNTYRGSKQTVNPPVVLVVVP